MVLMRELRRDAMHQYAVNVSDVRMAFGFLLADWTKAET